ncbi:hypothetical protein RCO48_01175 [Peribacillus frigoritolerans]|nr:hypothetical protein [Peribacillus frigoritolerans]
MIAHSMMGDPNASIPTPQPVLYRPMFASFGQAVASTSITFLSKASYEAGIHDDLGLKKNSEDRLEYSQSYKKRYEVKRETPLIEVDPQTYEVTVDGDLITCEPADILPMAQRYFLF